MWPEPYATIAAQREKGATNAEIAERLGKTPEQVKNMVYTWNCANPERRIPSRLETAYKRHERAVELRKQGKDRNEVAALLGVSPTRISNIWARARERGELPPRVANMKRGGYLTFDALIRKEASPRMGSMRNIIEQMSAEEVVALVNCTTKEDASLSDAIARIVKGYLRDS